MWFQNSKTVTGSLLLPDKVEHNNQVAMVTDNLALAMSITLSKSDLIDMRDHLNRILSRG